MSDLFNSYSKFENNNPTNSTLASFYARKENLNNYSESGIRKLKKNHPNKYKNLLLSYKMEFHPFVTIDEFAEFISNDNTTTKVNELHELVKANKIPSTRYINGKNEEIIYVPTILTSYIDLLQMFNELNINEAITLCIGNYKGGVLKTTNSCNIAGTYAYLGYNVLLVDADGQANATTSFGFRKDDVKKTVYELVLDINNQDIENELRKSILSVDTEIYFENGTLGKLDILPNQSSFEIMKIIDSLPFASMNIGTVENKLKELLKPIKKDYDFIFIDLPPTIGIQLRMGIRASDYFIFALTPEAFSEQGIPSMIEPVINEAKTFKKDFNIEYKVIGGIIGRNECSSKQDKDNLNDMITYFNKNFTESYGIFEDIIPRTKFFNDAQKTGSGVGLYYKPTAQQNKYYFNIARDLLFRVIMEKGEY